MTDVEYGPGFGGRYLQDRNWVYNLTQDAVLNVIGADVNALGADKNSFGRGVTNNSGISSDSNIFAKDIAQSRYFTVTVEKLRDENREPICFHSGGVFHDFLPVKSINLSYVDYENLGIPLASLGSIPILNKKRLSTIQIVSYDTDDDVIEKAVQRWEQICFPSSIYVGYLDEISSKFEYKSYDVKGNLVFIRVFDVVPTGSVQVSRSYDANSEKLVSFTLAVVGEPGATAAGSNYEGFNDIFETAQNYDKMYEDVYKKRK